MTKPELDPEKEQQRLDDLGERIDETRRDVDEMDPATRHEQTFAESGTIGTEDDDQTIAPPG